MNKDSRAVTDRLLQGALEVGAGFICMSAWANLPEGCVRKYGDSSTEVFHGGQKQRKAEE